MRDRMYDDWRKMQSRVHERCNVCQASADKVAAREHSHTHMAYEKVLEQVRNRHKQAEQEVRRRREHNQQAQLRRRERNERSHKRHHERRHERREPPAEPSADLTPAHGERRDAQQMSKCSCEQHVREPLAMSEALASKSNILAQEAVKELAKEAAEEAAVARQEMVQKLHAEQEAAKAKAAATEAAKAKVEAAANKAARAMEAAERAVKEAALAAQEAGDIQSAFEVIDVVEVEEAGSPDTEPEHYDELYPNEPLTGRGAREASGYTAAARRRATGAATGRSHAA